MKRSKSGRILELRPGVDKGLKPGESQEKAKKIGVSSALNLLWKTISKIQWAVSEQRTNKERTESEP